MLGWKLIKEDEYEKSQEALSKYANAVAQVAEMAKAIKGLGSSLQEARAELEANKFPSIDVGVNDPSPVDKEQRVLYVARVAGLHTDVMRPKLLQMISSLHQMLSEANNDREYDQSIKGAIYFAWEVLRWGDRMVNEQIAIQRGEHPELSEDKIKE